MKQGAVPSSGKKNFPVLQSVQTGNSTHPAPLFGKHHGQYIESLPLTSTQWVTALHSMIVLYPEEL